MKMFKENIHFVEFTPEKLGRLKVDHKKAVDENKAEFTFDGAFFLVVHAEYVIEYLEEQYSKRAVKN